VGTALQGGDGDRGVQEGGDADADRIEAFDLQQVLPVRDGVLDRVLRGELLARTVLEAGERDDW
jgi:hypothetical protein